MTPLTIRVRTPKGQFQYKLEDNDPVSTLTQKIVESIPEAVPESIGVSEDPRGKPFLLKDLSGNLAQLGLRHGSLLFATYDKFNDEISSKNDTGSNVSDYQPNASSSKGTSTLASTSTSTYKSSSNNDSVDRYYQKMSGRIERPKGKNGCRCSPRQMCDKCMPLEPYDAKYHEEHQIKHLSFQAWLRKISNGTNSEPNLEDPTYKVKVPCPSGEHAPWPAGICTKCQPSAITLQRQAYRMVDHVEFARSSDLENIVSFWRSSGLQRFGFLIGRYEPYNRVPLGVKAIVEGVYEPPQEPVADGVTIQWPWEDSDRIIKLANDCGLTIVGMIFTDLVPLGNDPTTAEGKVENKRNKDTFFMSSLEMRMAAVLQKLFPHPWAHSPTGKYDSRFITCVLTGDSENAISVDAYQVSDQTTSLVDADLVVPSVDPSLMLVKNESQSRYVPDIFYRQKNEYGIDAQHSASPKGSPQFPVDYLLVNLTHGSPMNPTPLFLSGAFPQANRPGFQDQSLEKVVSSYKSVLRSSHLPNAGFVATEVDESGVNPIAKWLSDWNLLAFLPLAGLFDSKAISIITQVAVDPKNSELLSQLYMNESWHTFLAIAIDDEPAPPSPSPARKAQPTEDSAFRSYIDSNFDDDDMSDISVHTARSQSNPVDVNNDFLDLTEDSPPESGDQNPNSAEIDCPYCTFRNPAGSLDCAVCGLPL